MNNIQKAVFAIAVFLLPTPIAWSQDTSAEKGDITGNEMDFWLGEWDLTWKNREGVTIQGSNVITKKWDKIIEEHFLQLTGKNKGYEGYSWTAARPGAGGIAILQTWVDSQGNYSTWQVVEATDKRVALESKGSGKQGDYWQRMEFYDIEENSISWRVGFSKDRTDWRWGWKIAYQRQGTLTNR